MSKRGKIYIILTTLVILFIIIAEVTKPKPVNWYPSYASYHKIPYGSFILKSQLKRMADSVIEVDRPPFEYLRTNNIKGTYLFFNGAIQYGDDELETLMDWTSQGNTLFIASIDFEETLLDTLHLNTSAIGNFDNFNNLYDVELVNPNLTDSNKYTFDKGSMFYHFESIDSLNTKVVGLIKRSGNEVDKDEQRLINIIKQPFGDGEIILSTFPQAFTNYFILNSPNNNYTAALLSYIDMDRPIYLDAHYKSGKKYYTSPMYLFLNNPNLKWAYYMALIGVLFYILFEGKRKQRPIPVIKALRNETLDFTRTISDMYYHGSKHKEITDHKIQHFMEYIRVNLHLQTSRVDSKFISDLAGRSNNSIQDTKQLFEYIELLKKAPNVNALQLEKLNTLIETFKSHNTWKTR